MSLFYLINSFRLPLNEAICVLFNIEFNGIMHRISDGYGLKLAQSYLRQAVDVGAGPGDGVGVEIFDHWQTSC